MIPDFIQKSPPSPICMQAGRVPPGTEAGLGRRFPPHIPKNDTPTFKRMLAHIGELEYLPREDILRSPRLYPQGPLIISSRRSNHTNPSFRQNRSRMPAAGSRDESSAGGMRQASGWKRSPKRERRIKSYHPYLHALRSHRAHPIRTGTATAGRTP